MITFRGTFKKLDLNLTSVGFKKVGDTEYHHPNGYKLYVTQQPTTLSFVVTTMLKGGMWVESDIGRFLDA